MSEKCPKCGASAYTTKLNCGTTVFTGEYTCESMDWPGHEFQQSDTCKLAALEAENARLRNELTGVTKARDLLLAGMESQSELMDGLKQESRELASLRQKLAELADDTSWREEMSCSASAKRVSKALINRLRSLIGGSGETKEGAG